MAIIKAPYNFVPLENKVYSPSWQEQIFQDIPFKDGISGVIELEIKAESPIYVRNGHTQQQAIDEKDSLSSFSNINDKFFIPGTSIKGSIRNVLEVISFGKMHIDKNAKFAQREWDNKELYTLKSKQADFKCGWLHEREDGNYEIISCGKPFRVGHREIDKYLGKDIMNNNFSKKEGIELNKEQKINGKKFDPKTAAYKYELLKDYKLHSLSFIYDKSYTVTNRRLNISSDGDINGSLVLTGQPDCWEYPRPKTLSKGAGKFYEFVFPDNIDNREKTHKLSKEEFNHYKFIYQDSPDWQYLKKDLRGKGVPVFFREDKGILKDFGLAFLYKLPYDNSPYGSLDSCYRDESKLDLAECIFGQIYSGKGALKGRVQFTNAFSDNAESDKELALSLGSPKASYYPTYIKQDGKNGVVDKYKTYNDGQLAGRKRYPIRETVWSQKSENQDVNTKLKPVKKGAIFMGKVKFHNLKPQELGALLSALTFHNTPGCYHQIGQGKPFGFGKVSVKANLKSTESKFSERTLMGLFEKEMCELLGTWHDRCSIVELYTMCHEQIKEDGLSGRYMNLEIKKDNSNARNSQLNEFVNVKKAKEYLDLYTHICKKIVKPDSIYAELKVEIEKEEREREEREKREKQEKEEREAREKKRIEDEQNRIRIQSFVSTGLSILSEKNLQDKYKVVDFKGVKDRVERWLKKAELKELPVDQHQYLYDALIRIYPLLKPKEQKEWQEFDKSNVWKNISNWIGSEIAKKWYSDIIK